MRPTGRFLPREDLSAMITEDVLNQAEHSGYVATRLMPYCWVNRDSGTYPVMPLKSLYNTADTNRTSSGAYNRAFEEFEQGNFRTREHGLEGPVDDRNAAVYKDVLDMEETVTKLTMGKVQHAHEIRVANKLMDTNNFPTQAAAAPWSDRETADPKKDVNTGIVDMRSRGVSPNTLEVSWAQYMNLLNCKAVKDAIHYIFPDTKKTGNITLTHLETYLEISIVVAGALFNSANAKKEPQLDGIWTDERALLCLTASQDSQVVTPCIGRTFIWNEGAKEEFVVEDYREDANRADIIRVRHDVDAKLLRSTDPETDKVLSDISRRCGLLITGIQ